MAEHDDLGDRLDELLKEHADVEAQLSDPDLHADQGRAQKVGRRYAELGPIVAAGLAWRAATDDHATARELSEEDSSFRQELPGLEATANAAAEVLRDALTPTDPLDDKDVILEVKAGEGGQESALFAGDLLRMYERYAERMGWKTEILDATPSDMGG